MSANRAHSFELASMSRLHQHKLVSLQSIVLQLQDYHYRFLIALATHNVYVAVFVLGMETKKENVFREKRFNTIRKDQACVQL